ncbi:MAG TPA: hypothetical protein VFC44_06070 [Candidatus Saccharimonadales bacterium]|nr:hypothetical protein [Candidatus Saccharimonadales bacterium]
MIILLAHTLFSIGIWNARDGYGEETSNIISAARLIQFHQFSPSLYLDVMALSLKYVSPDPLVVTTLMRYLSSLLATIAVYLTLGSFSTHLRRSAIVLGCFIWIASSSNAPFIQSTSLSLFTFSISLFGICCLLRKQSAMAFLGFYFFGLLAALLRPEYYIPICLITAIVAARIIWRGPQKVHSRTGLSPYGTCLLVLLALVAAGGFLWTRPPVSLAKEGRYLDKYALFGLGQCYADFYARNHRNEALSPMVDYKALLDRTFGKPKGFLDAIRNNPHEALRYFSHNATRNLFEGIKSLLGRYRERTRKNHGWLYWTMRVIFLWGGALGAMRLCHDKERWRGFFSRVIRGLETPNSLTRKLLLLSILLASSFPAILLLVPSERYFLPCMPLFYLSVAYSMDCLLRTPGLARYEAPLLVLACIVLCRPNYLTPRPNYEMDAVRHVAPYVKSNPRISGWWANPDVVLALHGDAEALGITDGLRTADIEQGRIDILLIDDNFRSTVLWSQHRAFFEHLERQPEEFDFKKLTNYPSGRFDVFYKPK